MVFTHPDCSGGHNRYSTHTEGSQFKNMQIHSLTVCFIITSSKHILSPFNFFFCIFQLRMSLQCGECKCLANGHSNTVYSSSNIPFSLFKAFQYHWYSGYKNFSIRDKLEQPSDMKAFPLYVGECCYNPARLRFSLVT